MTLKSNSHQITGRKVNGQLFSKDFEGKGEIWGNSRVFKGNFFGEVFER